MEAASPPIMLGISALRFSAMLTSMYPEKTGPMTMGAPWSIALDTSDLATPDWVCESYAVYSIWRFKMPPAALISFTASLFPLS
jgi:hypothetical protein